MEKADSNQQYKQKKIDLKYQAQRMKDYEFFVTPHGNRTWGYKEVEGGYKKTYNWWFYFVILIFYFLFCNFNF